MAACRQCAVERNLRTVSRSFTYVRCVSTSALHVRLLTELFLARRYQLIELVHASKAETLVAQSQETRTDRCAGTNWCERSTRRVKRRLAHARRARLAEQQERDPGRFLCCQYSANVLDSHNSATISITKTKRICNIVDVT